MTAMRTLAIFKNLVLILLLTVAASGTVNAKLASGPQTLGPDLHQAASGLEAAPRLGWSASSYDGVSESPVVTRGGIGPVLKGEAGVQRAITRAEARGETVLGREITIDTAAGRTRPDLLTRTPEGRLRFIECKNGPCAALNPRQRQAFPLIERQGGIPRGGNAAAAGLEPGVPIGPTEVLIERFP